MNKKYRILEVGTLFEIQVSIFYNNRFEDDVWHPADITGDLFLLGKVNQREKQKYLNNIVDATAVVQVFKNAKIHEI